MKKKWVKLVLASSIDGRIAYPEGGKTQLGQCGDRFVLEEAIAWSEMYPTVRDMCLHLRNRFKVKDMHVLVSDAFSNAYGGHSYEHGEIRDVELEEPDYTWAEKKEESEILALIPYWFAPVMWTSIFNDVKAIYTIVGVKSDLGVFDAVAHESVVKHFENIFNVGMNNTAMKAAKQKYSKMYGPPDEDDVIKLLKGREYKGVMFG